MINTIEDMNEYMEDMGIQLEKVVGTNPYLIHFNFYNCSSIINELVLEIIDEGPEYIVKRGKLHYTKNAKDFIDNIDFSEPSYNDVNYLIKKLKEGQYKNIEEIELFFQDVNDLMDYIGD